MGKLIKVFLVFMGFTGFVSIGISCSERGKDEPEIERPKPLLNMPEVYSTELDLDWVDYSGAVAYEVDVAKDAGFNDLVLNTKRVTRSLLLIENLTPQTTYFIRIRAEFVDGTLTENSNVVEVATGEVKTCDDAAGYIFQEKDGIIKVEFEDAAFGSGWELKIDNSNATGAGYMVWTGSDFFSKPSADLVTFEFRISTPGTYKFVWYTAVTAGESATEHNDTWLRFADADDFYGKKDAGGIVYPKGTGKTPNPEGASADGWFKIYRSGNDLDFKWQARTSDRDPHDIYVEFAQAKRYTMEISARSKAHGIDKFVLFLSSIDQSTATGTAAFSEITCL